MFFCIFGDNKKNDFNLNIKEYLNYNESYSK